MTTFNPQFVSDPPLQNVGAKLTKAGGQYYGDIAVVFDGGRKTVPMTVNLADLTQAERDAGLVFYHALHAKALEQMTDEDFKK